MGKRRMRGQTNKGTTVPLAAEQGTMAPPAVCAICPRPKHASIMAAFPATPAALFSGHFTIYCNNFKLSILDKMVKFKSIYIAKMFKKLPNLRFYYD